MYAKSIFHNKLNTPKVNGGAWRLTGISQYSNIRHHPPKPSGGAKSNKYIYLGNIRRLPVLRIE